MDEYAFILDFEDDNEKEIDGFKKYTDEKNMNIKGNNSNIKHTKNTKENKDNWIGELCLIFISHNMDIDEGIFWKRRKYRR